MTQDEIIRIAREAGAIQVDGKIAFYEDDLERFAALVAAHEREKHNSPSWETVDDAIAAEREACAKVCDEIERHKWEILTQGGKLEGLSSRDCAAAIRARSSK